MAYTYMKRNEGELLKPKNQVPTKTIKGISRVRNSRPKFKRYGSERLKRLETGWRRSKGIDSHVRLRCRGYPLSPNIGYRSPKNIRNLHPSGLIDILVARPADLENLNSAIHIIRIAHTVGMKKRLEILKIAKKQKLKLINPPKEPERKKETKNDSKSDKSAGGESAK